MELAGFDPNDYCMPTSLGGSQHIKSVYLAVPYQPDFPGLSYLYNTNNQEGAYHDFTNEQATLANGAEFYLNLQAGGVGSEFEGNSVAYKVWIDYDNDGMF